MGADQMKNKIYIAGPVTGDPEYRDKFNAAECYLIVKGWRVLNPAVLPETLDPADYLPICMAMLNQADAVVVLQGFAKSAGAKIEFLYSEYQNKEVYGSLESVPIWKEA